MEFALIMPLLFAMLFGCITFGIVFFHYISLTDSVGAGARFGATTPSTSAWPAAVRDRTKDYSARSLTSEQVCVQLVKGSSVTPIWSLLGATCASTAPPVTPAGLAITDCVVKVWAAQPDKLSAPPVYTQSITLSRSSVTRYERTC